MTAQSTLKGCSSLCGMLPAIILLLLLSCHYSFVAADYVIVLNNQVLHNPNNTDAQGNCCNDAEGTSNCLTPCDVDVCICVRPSGFDSLNGSICPFLRLSSTIGSNPNLFIPGPWMGGVQILLTVEDMDEDLVDLFLIELNGTATAANESVSATTMQYPGLRGSATLEMSTVVSCHSGFYGPSCDCQGRDDATGHFTCSGAGERVCLEGYKNVATNCTECAPAEGCSAVGGFCELPGECICYEDYSGDNCATGPLSSSTEDLLMPFSTLLLLEPFSTPSPSTAPMMSSIAMISSPTMTSSPVLISSSPVMISSLVSDMTTTAPLPLPSSSSQPLELTTTAMPSSPLFLSPTPSPFISLPSPQPTMTPLSSPRVSSSSPPSPPPPPPPTSSLSVATSSPQVVPSSAQPPSDIQPPSPVTSFLAAVSSSDIPDAITSSRPFDLSSTSSPPSFLPAAPSATDGAVLSFPPLTPIPPTPRNTVVVPPDGGQGGEGSGNLGAIVGAVMLIVAVLVLILIFVICIYVKMTNRKKSKRQRSIFLDQVYNTPVMFVNPEGAVPRSPQLIMQGGGGIVWGGRQEGGGGGADFVGDPEPRALDVTNEGPFHEIAYKAHEPYAERGPSREPSSSGENPPLYQLSEHDSTVFVNPNTEQPNLLAGPEDSSQQKRTGLGFVYKDDPIGDAYLTDQYQEQGLDVSGQSNGHMSRWNIGQSHLMAYGSGRSFTSGHENGNHRKYTNGHPSTVTHLTMPLAPPPLPKPRRLREGASPNRLGKKYGGQDVEEREQGKVAQELKSSSEGGQGEKKQKEEEVEKEKEVAKEESRKEGGGGGEEDEEGDNVQQRAAQYLQVAQEQSEKRQSYMQDILFTDINLDMSTQTEL